MSDRNPVTTIGFDADDTLWHNERFFKASERRLCELLADRAGPDAVMTCLLAVERRNVGIYGFGIKGFTLSMIETALEVGEGATPPTVIAEIVALGRRMLELPVEILPGVRETLDALAGRYRLLLITKGDLQDQERKLGGSGLAGMFAAVEIVSDKSAGTYADAFSRHGDGAERGLMVGNSLRSDILPALEAGAFAVHVPHDLNWDYETNVAAHDPDHPRLYVVREIRDVVAVVQELAG